jgi:hypothetical protein
MQHPVLDFSELHGVKLNLIPVSKLQGLKQRRISSLIRILLLKKPINDRNCGDLINDGNWDDRGRCLLVILVLILYQIKDLLEIVFKNGLIYGIPERIFS